MPEIGSIVRSGILLMVLVVLRQGLFADGAAGTSASASRSARSAASGAADIFPFCAAGSSKNKVVCKSAFSGKDVAAFV
jgi:hypothetical protein